MDVNYRNQSILEAEMVDGHETLTVGCEVCGSAWLIEDNDIIVDPYPHFECPQCKTWIPLF